MDMVMAAYEEVLKRVLEERDPVTGVWTGELASSALATALALTALEAGDEADQHLVEAGAGWLVQHANADGGWGDTTESVSNLSTTLIAAAALRRLARGGAGKACIRGAPWAGGEAALRRAEAWLSDRAGGLSHEAVAQALKKVYGPDRTFAVPILAFLAACGTNEKAWLSVPSLPFLMALLPQRLYRFFRLQVVSYALPALIAVGLCRHVCAAGACGRWAWGHVFAGALLRRLARLQPEHGGFLDAVPLTAFVCLALREAGYGAHPAARKGLDFLRRAARADGSWAIDSNLRTWVTSLATRALFAGLREGACARPDIERIVAWYVKTQVKGRHPFTGARPGGWAWTDLPGGVPDADDTAGALIALRRLADAGCQTDVRAAVLSGVGWLLDLQNRDGGTPTFCRGWGKLPFDRSCPDISAHALAALTAWADTSCGKAVKARHVETRVRKACERGLCYLGRAQQEDGSWQALWFGHQESGGGMNPVVGTARVVDALRAMPPAGREADFGSKGSTVDTLLARGERWLVAAQKKDGGWSAGRISTVEETALAVIALTGGGEACDGAVRSGRLWLAEHWREGCGCPAPIGLYFALLWYHEKMYPLAWTLEALGPTRFSPLLLRRP